ncbi:MAG: hypothetical protein Q9168_005873 [Polycauliona sp. 1 TL-2023]
MALLTLRHRSLVVVLAVLVAVLYLAGPHVKLLGSEKACNAACKVNLAKESLVDNIGVVRAGYDPEDSSVRSSIATNAQGSDHDSDQSNGNSMSTDGILVKRLPPQCTPLIQNGVKLARGVWQAFGGNLPPATPYGRGYVTLAKVMGWDRQRIDNVPLPEVWKDAFKMIPASVPGYKEFPPLGKTTENTQIDWHHRLPYSYGDKVPRRITNAVYQTLYVPSAKAIISRAAWSPTAALRLEIPNPTRKDIDDNLPRLHRLSDIMWLDWTDLVKKEDESGLRYIARENIKGYNEVSLIEQISKARRQTTDIPWSKRMTFEIDSSEGLAILGTAHGTGLAWLLMHRAQNLGDRNPQVTIFNPEGKTPCLIWDLIPVPDLVLKDSTFGELQPPEYCDNFLHTNPGLDPPPPFCQCLDCVNWPGWLERPGPGHPDRRSIANATLGQTESHFVSQDSSLQKRAPDKYQCLVEGGMHALQGIVQATGGSLVYPAPNWGKVDDKLANAHGWARTRDDSVKLPEVWKDAFKLMPAPLPGYKKGPNDTENTVIEWNHRLPYVYGDCRQRIPTGAFIRTMYVPGAKAIISEVAISPPLAITLGALGITPKNWKDNIPRLASLSDIMWLDWVDLAADPAELRYIARQDVRGNDIEVLTKAIFTKRRGTLDVPWSRRLTFEVDQTEFLSILGSPPGKLVAWILIHHATILDHRNPQVTIFNPGGHNLCIIWDLIPGIILQTPPGTFGEVQPPGYCPHDKDKGPLPPYCACSTCYELPGVYSNDLHSRRRSLGNATT